MLSCGLRVRCGDLTWVKAERCVAPHHRRMESDAPLAADDLVIINGRVIRVTPRRRLPVRAIAMCFDRRR
jgi:hypothetical protein